MKLRLKIYLMCLFSYILVLAITGIIMIEKGYRDELSKEIGLALKEEESITSFANGYISFNVPSTSEEELANIVLNGFKEKDIWIEIYSSKKKLLISNFSYKQSIRRDELDRALKGEQNYVLRKDGDEKYLFVTDTFSNGSLLCLIKNVSKIDRNRTSQYMFFARLAIAGLILLSLIIPFISRFITNSIIKLTKSTEIIASGNYSNRVEVSSRDEIGVLASRFNIMAAEIESRVFELADQGDKKQRFIDNLIHELRTPLTSIIGYSEFLMNNNCAREVTFKALSNINSEGKRLLEVSEKLMGLVLLNNHDSIDLKEQNVRCLLQEIAEDMYPKLKSKGINLIIEADDITILIDRDLIKSVVTNLIDNAIKASNAGSKITIGAKESEGDKCVFVMDEGRGIPESEINKVTEPFYMVDKARSRKYGGAGLGLAICKEIIEAHDAEMRIKSREGKGTVIDIVFNY